jgi:hypothetical protein
MERRTRRLRRLFSLAEPRRRELATSAVALATLPALVAVAATQPVVIHKRAFTQRVDAQVFVVFDTSLSMRARSSPDSPTRLQRAEREAEALVPKLGEIPVGIATITDRLLPNLMPTTNAGLVMRTIHESVRIDEPPAGIHYQGRASSFDALLPLEEDRFFPPGVTHPILVIFTDGEERPPVPGLSYDSTAEQLTIPPFFVHVWAPGEHVYFHGRVARNYQSDPTSEQVLTHFARLTRGKVLREGDVGGLLDAIRGEAGSKPARTMILGYARIPLGQWFLLAGVFPLGFLFWRRNL